MKDKDTGKMYAELTMFIIACIPVVLCAVCFGIAGLEYIANGETDLMHRLAVVGSILGGASFMFAISAALVHDNTRPAEGEEEDDVH